MAVGVGFMIGVLGRVVMSPSPCGVGVLGIESQRVVRPDHGVVDALVPVRVAGA